MKLRRIMAFAVLIACAAISIYIALANPDMTRTRLFLTFWPIYVPLMAVTIGAYWLIVSDK